MAPLQKQRTGLIRHERVIQAGNSRCCAGSARDSGAFTSATPASTGPSPPRQPRYVGHDLGGHDTCCQNICGLNTAADLVAEGQLRQERLERRCAGYISARTRCGPVPTGCQVAGAASEAGPPATVRLLVPCAGQVRQWAPRLRHGAVGCGDAGLTGWGSGRLPVQQSAEVVARGARQLAESAARQP